MNWYPRYPGDYMRDTAHLSLVEHGAYTVLLDHYYSTGGPLPEDVADLMRICRAFEEPERHAVRKIADLFFPVSSDGLRHNHRADKQLIEMAEKHDKLSDAGKRGMEKRWKDKRYNEVTKQTINEAITYPQPQPQPQPYPKKEEGAGCSPDPQFLRCWEAFEKYGVRKKALTYWRKYAKADRDAIEAAIPVYMQAVRAGRTRKQFEGWINPEHRLWDMDWSKAVAVEREKMTAKNQKLINTWHDKDQDMSMRNAF